MNGVFYVVLSQTSSYHMGGATSCMDIIKAHDLSPSEMVSVEVYCPFEVIREPRFEAWEAYIEYMPIWARPVPDEELKRRALAILRQTAIKDKWFVEEQGIEVRVGYRGTAVAGISGGTAISGDDGISYAGSEGLAVSGDRGTSTSGDNGRAFSGDYGLSTSGVEGQSISKYGGKSISGKYGQAISGDRGLSMSSHFGVSKSGINGVAITGCEGQAISGVCGQSESGTSGCSIADFGGKAKSGINGVIQITWKENVISQISRTITGCVGENGIKANTWYRVNAIGELVETSG